MQFLDRALTFLPLDQTERLLAIVTIHEGDDVILCEVSGLVAPSLELVPTASRELATLIGASVQYYVVFYLDAHRILVDRTTHYY